MHGNIAYLFDFWAYLVVHLLLLKSSMLGPSTKELHYKTNLHV